MKDILLTVVVMGVTLTGGFRSAASGLPQSVTKHIELANFPNPPVEILSVKLGNKLLDNEEKFVATADWTSKLEVTVKNVSERPVSFIEIFLYTPGDTDEAMAVFNAFLEFKSGNGVDAAPPGQNVKLKHRSAHGNILDSRPARIQINRVEWENDPVNVWLGGEMWIRSPDGTYSKPPKAMTRYGHPSKRSPAAAVHHVRAVAAPTPMLTYCNVDAAPSQAIAVTRVLVRNAWRIVTFKLLPPVPGAYLTATTNFRMLRWTA